MGEEGARPPARQALGIQSEKAPSFDIFGLQHLVVEGFLNFDHNAQSSGRFYKLADPVDAMG